MKLVTVLGARPQFIKASVVSAQLAKHTKVAEVIVHTGQHFDANMSDVFFAELGMAAPNYELNIHGGGHGEMTGRMLVAIEKVLTQERPDVVMVYGDTNSTLAGALAAAKLRIPVAHVESGLRSFNMRMPEEINRILTDRISTWLFAPTEGAVKHLLGEGIKQTAIHQVGDVMYDAALHHGARATDRKSDLLARVGIAEKAYVLTTIHRAENTDDAARLAIIVQALAQVSRELPVVWPMHPRTRSLLARHGLWSDLASSVRIVEPLGYLDMVQLEQAAAVIATDSGGVQKEAFFHKVPCVTLRDETEWTELVSAGWNRIAAPNNCKNIVQAILAAKSSKGAEVAPYGKGDSAKRIVEHLYHQFQITHI